MKQWSPRALFVSLSASLSACSVAPLQSIKIPVPVECRAEVPARPAMPTEALAPGINPDQFVTAAMAEIELREGYEGELRAALIECVKPTRLSASKTARWSLQRRSH